MMLSTTRRPPRAALFLCLALPAAPLSAQDRYSDQVAEQLDEAEALVIAEGFTLDGQSAGWMMGEEAATTTWTLIPGDWAVVGACDEDCGDVDLEALTVSGEPLDRDTASDALPVLTFSLDEGADIALRLTMPACGTRRCYVAYRWYHRQSGEDSGAVSWRATIGAQFGMIDLANATLDHERLELVDAGGTDSFTVDLAGGAYMAVAVCDADCSDVDLFVRDGSGQEVGRDVLEDDVPVVEFDAGNGPYRFDVAMEACSTSTCGYGFRLYRKGG